MKAIRRKVWIRRGVRVCLVLGLVLLGVSIASLFVMPLYQQPPGAWKPPPGSVPSGGGYTVPPDATPSGKIRVRLMAGSLIVSNGDLPLNKLHVGMVTLGYMFEAGVKWVWISPSAALKALSSASVWKWYFYKEQVQVQLFPIAALLLAPWALRRWVFKEKPEWACQRCGYDLRGKPEGPCPECGTVAADKSHPTPALP